MLQRLLFISHTLNPPPVPVNTLIGTNSFSILPPPSNNNNNSNNNPPATPKKSDIHALLNGDIGNYNLRSREQHELALVVANPAPDTPTSSTAASSASTSTAPPPTADTKAQDAKAQEAKAQEAKVAELSKLISKIRLKRPEQAHSLRSERSYAVLSRHFTGCSIGK